MRRADILRGPHVWSCQNDFGWIMFIFSHSVNMTQKSNSKCIKWYYSIGYFDRYVDSKSDYLELLLSVCHCLDTEQYWKHIQNFTWIRFVCHGDHSFT